MPSMDFSTYLTRVDSKVEAIVGLGLDDLPDTVSLADLHHDGVSPAEAARQVLEGAGWKDEYAI